MTSSPLRPSPRVTPGSLRAWTLAARPKTLTGAAIPVITASALAWADGVFSLRPALVCLLFACLMQVAANFINDLFDFLKGSDRADRLGPERACAQGWLTPREMKRGIALVLAAAAACGLTLLTYGRPEVLVGIGVGCIVFAFLYTTLLSYCGLGDVLVVMFFGLVPVAGTYYVQSGMVNASVWMLSLSCGILIDSLLVVNNYRDRDTDRRDGKRTLIALLGEPFGRYLYLLTGLTAWALCACFLTEGRTWAFALPALYVPLHVLTWRRMAAIRSGRELNAILGQTSRNMLIFALLLSIGLVMR